MRALCVYLTSLLQKPVFLPDLRNTHKFLWGCSSVWLERPPVTRKAAGSSPVSPATLESGGSSVNLYDVIIVLSFIRFAL